MDPRHKSFKLQRLNSRQQQKYLASAATLARGVYEAYFMGDAESQTEAAEADKPESPAKRKKLEPHLRRDYTVDAAELLGRDSEVPCMYLRGVGYCA